VIYTIEEFPVFEPNEYFWTNFWQEGKEEKWQTYARIMRQIIADHSGLEISKCTMEDKIAYK